MRAAACRDAESWLPGKGWFRLMGITCQSCKKHRATVHLTEMSPEGEKTERHVCDQCAAEEGIFVKAQGNQPLNEILGGLVLQKSLVQQLSELTCPKCKLTFVEFRNNGLLGCSGDYDAFESALLPLIERAHDGAGHHIGKVPRRLVTPRSSDADLVRLRAELNRAVTDEQFEKAARLRDQIRTLEQP